MSFLGAKSPQDNKVIDTTKAIATGSYVDQTPAQTAAVAPSMADPELEAAAAAARTAKGRSGTFLSLLGDTSGKSVSRRTLLGS